MIHALNMDVLKEQFFPKYIYTPQLFRVREIGDLRILR
jgi:hypothetical protein